MKRFFSILWVAILPVIMLAEVRSEKEAAQLAADFINQQSISQKRMTYPRTASSMRLAHTGMTSDQQKAAYYIFNQGNEGGMVIVSADDRTEAILGYTDQGDFNYETANPSLRWWLDRYAKMIAAIPNDAKAQPRTQTQDYTPIAPLLGNIKYDQDAPYYNLCPKDNGIHSLTGCVATAAAQVMRKWQHPAQGTGEHSYKAYTLNKTLSVDFSQTTYDWANMLETYSSTSYTYAQANAIATLMYHCGVACEMDYSAEASGALTDDMAYGLATYFSYDIEKFVTQYSKKDYGTASYSPAEYNVSTSTLTSYFHQDLEAGCPIIMGGSDKSGDGGHEFVCDGRDKNGKFHINWGWSGDGNGYFTLNSLEMQDYDFSYGLDAIIGLKPGKIDTVHVESITLNKTDLTLKINEKQSLTATILPDNSTIRIATWTSQDPTIASVTQSGLVRGLKQGTTTIIATAEDQQHTCTVTVTNEVVASQAFELITNAGDLAVGDEVIIVNQESEMALGTTQNTNNRNAVSVTINDMYIELEDDTDVQIITLQKGNKSNTFAFPTPNGYLYAASSKKNWLRSEAQISDNSSWTITINGDGEATVKAQGTNTRNILQYNSVNDLFSAYSGTQQPVSIYARHPITTDLQSSTIITSQPRKQIIDGRFVIINNGKRYDAQGRILK